MPKRRRERDRPKIRPDAPYNPHKRVLLSYGSDVEEGTEASPEPSSETGHPGALDLAAADYRIQDYSDAEETPPRRPLHEARQEDEEDEEDPLEHCEVKDVVASEQDNLEHAGFNNRTLSSKRSRGPRRDEATGQWPALGPIVLQYEDDNHEEEEQDDTTEEAMAYLRAVRSERQNLPAVLRGVGVAADHPTPTDDLGGFLDDDAYIGRQQTREVPSDDVSGTIEPQDAFATAIKKKFLVDRASMMTSKNANDVQAASDQYPTMFIQESRTSREKWLHLLRSAVPAYGQVHAMDQTTVFGLLDLVIKQLLVREMTISPNTSAWIWSLLSRLDDVGSMDHENVAAVRELGKKAILVQLSFHDPIAAERLELSAGAEANNELVRPSERLDTHADAQNEHDVKELPSQCILEAINPAAGARDNSAKTANTLATLEASIAIVGDIFGQRDLLDFRQPWKREGRSTGVDFET